MSNQGKIIVALSVLVLIIVVPSVVIWKVFFAPSDLGVVTVVNPQPSQPAGAAVAAGSPAASLSNGTAPVTANAGRVKTRTTIRTAVAARPRVRVAGGITTINAALPADYAAGPAATASGPVTAETRRKYLESLWVARPTQNEPQYGRGDWVLYTNRKGTVMPTTAPSDPALAATLVTVHAAGSVMDVLQAVAEQSHVRFVSSYTGLLRGTPATVRIDADREPLMEVLGEIFCQAGLVPQQVIAPAPGPAAGGAGSQLAEVVVNSQQPHQTLGPWVVSGSCAYMVEQIYHAAAIPETGQGDQTLQLTIRSQCEPKVHALVGPGNFTVTEAVDDRGNSLLPGGQPIVLSSLYGGQWMESTNETWPISLSCPPGFGHKIVRLVATDHLVAETAGSLVTLAAPTRGSPVRQSVGGMEIEASVDGQAMMYGPGGVAITYRRGTLDARQWKTLRPCLSGVTCRAFGASGTELTLQQAQTYQPQQMTQVAPTAMGRLLSIFTGGPTASAAPAADADAYTRIYSFWDYTNRGERISADHFVLDVPTRVKAFDVPVEFDNLPLP